MGALLYLGHSTCDEHRQGSNPGPVVHGPIYYPGEVPALSTEHKWDHLVRDLASNQTFQGSP